MTTKKLIEVALPLDVINKASIREKSIRHGHPSALHLWWARRPFTSARAIIWASLVDDPSSHPEIFPTDADQIRERNRLFSILEKLVTWENANNETILKIAKQEIFRYINKEDLPLLIDPFSGGGAIPYEAQRLGLTARACDLNPVAVMINRALVEIPPKFYGLPPVNPNMHSSKIEESWKGSQGIAEDVKYYGSLLCKKAFGLIGQHYPKVDVPDEQGGGKATVIAWIWARTVICPNPACGCEMPLVKAFNISKKKGKEAVIVPHVNGRRIEYTISSGTNAHEGTVGRTGAKCIFCGNPVDLNYIRNQGKQGNIGRQMIGIIAEGEKGRLFLAPNKTQVEAANVKRPEGVPSLEMPYNPRNFNTPNYGMNHFEDVFTNRQLMALVTFSSLLNDIQLEVEKDAISCGIDKGKTLRENGRGAVAYSEAIRVYLALLIDQLANQSSSLCSWHVNNIQMKSTFSRQSLPMVWDYAESNVFCNSSGSYHNMLKFMVDAIYEMHNQTPAIAMQHNAMEGMNLESGEKLIVSTDPPYYDNICYGDLADYFYMWLRKNLVGVYPDLFNTIKVPKEDELIASQFRFNGDINAARTFFEEGMTKVFNNLSSILSDDYPMTVFYAFKQSDFGRNASGGWDTMLQALMNAGFRICGTWPIRTEMTTGVKTNLNVLASSIVIVCRKRTENNTITRRGFVNSLRNELKTSLLKLQQSSIAPVDLAQAAIGPGMEVFSRYRRVLEADGTPMSVTNALQVINEEIDTFFNEQVGEMDAVSRFCIDIYTQSAFNDMKFGDADILARAKGTSVAAIVAHNVAYAKAGIVHLLERTDIPEKIDKDESCIWLLTQQLTQAMATGGVEACAKAVFTLFGSNAERAKDLAYRLYTIAEQKKWANEAYSYNALVVAWPDIQTRAAMLGRETAEQIDLFSSGVIE